MRTATKTPLFPLLALAALAVACEQPIGPEGATAPGPVPGGEPSVAFATVPSPDSRPPGTTPTAS